MSREYGDYGSSSLARSRPTKPGERSGFQNDLRSNLRHRNKVGLGTDVTPQASDVDEGLGDNEDMLNTVGGVGGWKSPGSRDLPSVSNRQRPAKSSRDPSPRTPRLSSEYDGIGDLSEVSTPRSGTGQWKSGNSRFMKSNNESRGELPRMGGAGGSKQEKDKFQRGGGKESRGRELSKEEIVFGAKDNRKSGLSPRDDSLGSTDRWQPPTAKRHVGADRVALEEDVEEPQRGFPRSPRPLESYDRSRRSPRDFDRTRRSPDNLRLSPDALRRSPDAVRRSPEVVRRSPEVAHRSPESLRRSPDAPSRFSPRSGDKYGKDRNTPEDHRYGRGTPERYGEDRRSPERRTPKSFERGEGRGDRDYREERGEKGYGKGERDYRDREPPVPRARRLPSNVDEEDEEDDRRSYRSRDKSSERERNREKSSERERKLKAENEKDRKKKEEEEKKKEKKVPSFLKKREENEDDDDSNLPSFLKRNKGDKRSQRPGSPGLFGKGRDRDEDTDDRKYKRDMFMVESQYGGDRKRKDDDDARSGGRKTPTDIDAILGIDSSKDKKSSRPEPKPRSRPHTPSRSEREKEDKGKGTKKDILDLIGGASDDEKDDGRSRRKKLLRDSSEEEDAEDERRERRRSKSRERNEPSREGTKSRDRARSKSRERMSRADIERMAARESKRVRDSSFCEELEREPPHPQAPQPQLKGRQYKHQRKERKEADNTIQAIDAAQDRYVKPRDPSMTDRETRKKVFKPTPINPKATLTTRLDETQLLDTSRSECSSSSDIRSAVYAEWYKAKMERSREDQRVKSARERKETKEKEEVEKQKRLGGQIAFKCWREDRGEDWKKDKQKKLHEERKKEEEKEREKREKKEQSVKYFKMWKEDKDVELRKKKRKELEKQREEEYNKKTLKKDKEKDNDSAVKGWRREKEEKLTEKAREEHKKKLEEKRKQREKEKERERESEDRFREWQEKKEQQLERAQEEERYQKQTMRRYGSMSSIDFRPAWSPAGRTIRVGR